jgi:hypothetical protein
MTNPAAGVDLTGWTSSTCSPVRATGLAGLPRTTGVQSTGSGFFRTPTVACAPGDQFTVSFYTRNDSAAFQFGHTIYIGYTTSGHGEQFPETFVSTNVDIGAVARSSKVADVTKVPVDATGIFLIMDSYPAGITQSAVLFEKVAAVDTYFDGTFPDAAWDGTTDLSASTRTYTLETIAWPDPPTLTDAADGTSDYNMGLAWSLTAGSNGYCYGVDWNPSPLTARSVPGGQQYATLWNLDTHTLLHKQPFTHNVFGGQQRVYFDKQPAVTSGVTYGVAIYTVSYVYRSVSSWTVTSPSGRIHADKGRLHVGGAGTPIEPEDPQDALYFVAPVLSFGGAAPPAGPTLSVWNGTAEVPATLSVWNGTAEVPAVLDSIV